jgi:hypothetical protein
MTLSSVRGAWFACLLGSFLTVSGCGGGDTAVDAGTTPDAGMMCISCAPPPPGCRLEGTTCTSCGTLVCEDASIEADAGSTTDAGTLADAGSTTDAGMPADAGSNTDGGPGCPPPVCPTPPPGCEYAGGSACNCGALLCPVSPTCGSATCGAGEFCNASAGSCDASSGACETRPEVCPSLFAPVCGCDGQTYPNACEAAGMGTSVAFDGECPADCRTTGCPAGSGCQGCRGPRGGWFVCIPDGAVC